jgi:hypothetical protein
MRIPVVMLFMKKRPKGMYSTHNFITACTRRGSLKRAIFQRGNPATGLFAVQHEHDEDGVQLFSETDHTA